MSCSISPNGKQVVHGNDKVDVFELSVSQLEE